MFNAQVSDAFLALVDAFLRTTSPGLLYPFTGTTASTPNVTATSSLVGIAIGDVITGPNITNTPPTTVVAMDNPGHTMTLSQNASGAGVGDHMIAHGPIALVGLQMGLYTASDPLSPTALLANFIEPVFTGYAKQTLVGEPVRKNANNDYIEGYGSVHFQPTVDPVTPQTVIGYFVVATIAGTLQWVYAEAFDTPVIFAHATDGLDVSFDGMTKNLKTWGGLCGTC